MTELDLHTSDGAKRPLEAIAPLQRLTTLISTAIKHQLYTYPKGEKSNLMSQSLWLFGSRLTIVADHTTTAGHYDLIEEYSVLGSRQIRVNSSIPRQVVF